MTFISNLVVYIKIRLESTRMLLDSNDISLENLSEFAFTQFKYHSLILVIFIENFYYNRLNVTRLWWNFTQRWMWVCLFPIQVIFPFNLKLYGKIPMSLDSSEIFSHKLNECAFSNLSEFRVTFLSNLVVFMVNFVRIELMFRNFSKIFLKNLIEFIWTQMAGKKNFLVLADLAKNFSRKVLLLKNC